VRAPPALAATLKVIVPLPVPLAFVIVSHEGARLEADQAQPARVVIWKLPEPPLAGKLCGLGDVTE
jgi:hypothetical protein